MSKRSSDEWGHRVLAALLAGLLLTARPIWAAPKPLEVAVIENTGSTNTFGYHIFVNRDSAVPSIDGMQAAHRLPPALRQKFFKDLHAAMPLTSLPVHHGMRSASFGTQTVITYHGQKSPDLTFGSNARTAALRADVDTITKTLGVGGVPRRPVMPQNITH